MNTQPTHDPETGDLRGSSETVAMPGDISIGNLPNSDTPTDDMRGHEPALDSDAQHDHTGMIISVVAVAGMISALGIFSYATGTWDSGPATPARTLVAANDVAPVVPAAEPQQAAVATPVPSVAVEGPPVPAPVMKPAAAPRSVVRAAPNRAVAPPPEIGPTAPVIAAPVQADPIMPTTPAIEPMPPMQSMPDQTTTPAPQ